MQKKPASPHILSIYSQNKARLQTEQQKAERDLATNNAIDAYSHILRKLEERYEIAVSSSQKAA